MSALDLDPIKDRLAKATPGPWAVDTAKWDPDDHSAPDLVIRHDGDPSVCNPLYARNVARCYPGDADMDTASGQEQRDTRFIANAPSDIAALVAEVEALRRVLVFADGMCLQNTGLVLADLYAADCVPVQEALSGAGCWPRGSFKGVRT